jgi:hypothetical protein
MNVRLMAVAVLTFGALAHPGTAAVYGDSAKSPQYDPNERICENVTMLGSRIAKKRICASRAQWEEMKRQDRAVVEDAQKKAADPCNAVLTHTGAAAC